MLEVSFSPFPELLTERLRLRAVTVSDAVPLFAMRSDPRIMVHIGRPMAVTIDDALNLIDTMTKNHEANDGLTWAITIRSDDTMIGAIGYYRLKKEHYRGEVGYMLAMDHWRKGIMREALAAVVQCGFNRLGFHSIEAITSPENTASNALLASCGFIREGLFKEDFFWNGEFRDSAHWSKLAK